jgi:hypothetical protein
MASDIFLKVSDAQALSGAAAAVSTDTVPLGAAGLDLGAGEPMGLAFHIDVAADVASANETYEFQIIGATAADGTTGQVILASRAFTTAQAAALTAGTRFALAFPVGSLNASSITHVGARYVLAGTTPTVTVTAYFTPLSMFDERNVTIRNGFVVAA